MKLQHGLVAVLTVLFCQACAIRKDVITPFVNPTNTPGVDVPDDASKGTKYCAPDAAGNFDGNAIHVQGDLGADSVAWADGGGCVLRPIREVWAALNNIEEMKWEEANSLTFQRTDHPEKDFTHLYHISYSKKTPIGPIEWTIDWFHGFDEGTFDAPKRVNIKYQKVSGTPFILVWGGSITLSKVRDGLTSFAVHVQLKSAQSDSDNVQSAESASTELTRKARSVPADWVRLNTGFHVNPGIPD